VSFPAPFVRYEVEVQPSWIDANDHMNMGYYVVMFDLATDELWDALGIGKEYKRIRRLGTFAVEGHILYENEMLLSDRGHVRSRVIGHDRKRLHVAHELIRARDGKRAASHELLFLHIDLEIRRVAPWPEDILTRLAAAERAHASLPPLDFVGRRIALPTSTAS
jgi:acyl-CoA thioester hydrolase